jgi:Tfp pilus assembly protein PilE
MSRNKDKYYNEERNKIEKANRIEELESLVESHTRTERHLEEHSDISSSKKISQSIEKQAEREYNIGILEHKITSGQQPVSNEAERLERNYTFAKGYMEHNQEHMDKVALENMKERQQNRRDKMDGLT